MIYVLNSVQRSIYPDLFRKMYQSRAAIFHEKLGWDVVVRDGLEYDQHDIHSDPLYMVLTDEAENVIGSLRLLPTTGDTMMTREFAHMFDEPVDLRSPTVWECTRFCVPHSTDLAQHLAASRASSELLISLCTFCLAHGIDHVIGLYETPMTRIYRRIGWSPTVLARSKPEVGRLLAGIWDATETALANMRALAQRGLRDVHASA